MQKFLRRNFSGLVLRRGITWVLMEIWQSIRESLDEDTAATGISMCKDMAYGYNLEHGISGKLEV